MSAKIKLLGNRVLIEPIIETKNGSIYLVRMSRQMPDKGRILAISAEAAKISGCAVGDRVIFDKHKQALEEDHKTTMLSGDEGEELLLAILA